MKIWVDLEGTVQNERRQKKTHTIWSHCYVESNQNNKKIKVINAESRLVIARGRGWVESWVKWVKGVKRYKLLVIGHGNVMYSMRALANDTVLCIWKLLGECISELITRKKVTVCGDGCELCLLQWSFHNILTNLSPYVGHLKLLTSVFIIFEFKKAFLNEKDPDCFCLHAFHFVFNSLSLK